mgnify:CR=1 FL=1
MVTTWYLRRKIKAFWPAQKTSLPSPGQVSALANVDQLVFPSVSLCYHPVPVLAQFLAVQDQTRATKQRVLSVAASIAAAHPYGIFSSLTKAAEEFEEPLRELEVDQISELGLTGKLDRTWFILGNAFCMQQEQIELGVAIYAIAQKFEAEGKTVLFLAQRQPKRVLGIFALGYTPTPDSAAALEMLQDMGVEVLFLTSMQTNVAKVMSHELDVPVIQAELSLQEKRHVVHALLSTKATAAAVVDARGGGIDSYTPIESDPIRTILVGTSRGVTEDEGLLNVRSLDDLVDVIKISRMILAQARKALFWKRI